MKNLSDERERRQAASRRSERLERLGQQMVDLCIGMRLALDPDCIREIPEIDAIDDDSVWLLAFLMEQHPNYVNASSPLTLVKALREEPELIEVAQWLYIAPASIRRLVPPLAELIDVLENRANDAARKIQPKSRAWERHLDNARGAA